MDQKITRDAFLYLTGTNSKFAQCSSCSQMTPGKMCVPIGIPVEDGWTCGLYVHGTWDGGRPLRRVSAKDAGLVKRQVRCENCRYGGDNCALYEKLNKQFPNDFALEEKIEPKACCNAWKESDAALKKRGSSVPGARLAPDGRHYVADPKRPGKYLVVA